MASASVSRTYLAKIYTFLKVAIWRADQNHPPSTFKGFYPIVKLIELARITSSALFFSLAEENVFEEQGKEDAHHQAISDQRRNGIWEELKEWFRDNGDRRPHQDWNS